MTCTYPHHHVAAKPVLKWPGGKARLLPEILARLPARFNRYYEPFAGGAALFFKLAPANATLGDANPELINLYRVLARGDVEGLITYLAWHQEQHYKDEKTHYNLVRSLFNGGACWSSVQRAAAFVYFNKTCFNGLWRVNKDGKFNVPIGKYVKPTICDADALRAAALALSKVTLRQDTYMNTVADAQPGDLVYFDPPYVPLNPTSSFTAYTADGFGHAEQCYLAGVARELAGCGVHVILSNSDTPLVRELYQGFQVDVVQCGRGINSDASKRGAVNELLITSALPTPAVSLKAHRPSAGFQE